MPSFTASVFQIIQGFLIQSFTCVLNSVLSVLVLCNTILVLKESTFQMESISLNQHTFIKGIWRTINNSITNELNWPNGCLCEASPICNSLILYLQSERVWISNGYNHPRHVDVLLTFLVTSLCFCMRCLVKYLYLFSEKENSILKYLLQNKSKLR